MFTLLVLLVSDCERIDQFNELETFDSTKASAEPNDWLLNWEKFGLLCHGAANGTAIGEHDYDVAFDTDILLLDIIQVLF